MGNASFQNHLRALWASAAVETKKKKGKKQGIPPQLIF
jgi:hypothetical protein